MTSRQPPEPDWSDLIELGLLGLMLSLALYSASVFFLLIVAWLLK